MRSAHSSIPFAKQDRRRPAAAELIGQIAKSYSLTPSETDLHGTGIREQESDRSKSDRDLWDDYLDAIGENKRIDRAIEEATARLPEWARPGPERVSVEHGLHGPISNWPSMGYTAPEPGISAFRTDRFHLSRIKRDYKLMVDTWQMKGASRANYRAGYRKRVRAWIARVREQRTEFEKVGLPALETKREALGDVSYDICCRIADRRGLEPNVVAGKILIGIISNELGFDPVGSVHTCISQLLEDLRPSLSAGTARVVDDFLAARADRDAKFSDLSFWH